ncbi:MAG: hypothetical protein M3022_01560 [Actinomycetota bacterium]|nr:hypothetical protein [Actinomycetota bacterium]
MALVVSGALFAAGATTPPRASPPRATTTGSRFAPGEAVHRTQPTHPRRQWHQAVTLASWAWRAPVTISAPAGTLRRLRLILPHGARATAIAVIPTLAGLRVSSPAIGPAARCGRHGSVDVCTQDAEACPMPAANWQVRVTRYRGPAGTVRVELVLADPLSA